MCLGMGFTLSLVMSYVQFFDQGLFELDHHHRGFNSSSGCEQELANHVNQTPVPAIQPVGGIEQKPEELRSKNYSYSERHVESTAPSTSDLVDLISHNRQIGNDVPIYIFKELMQKKRKIGTFVEFGCADGIKHSNSYAFEQMGWSGLCIEPNYPNYLKAKQVRKNAIFALVTGKPGKFTYAQGGPECDQGSGIVEFYSPEYLEIMKNCEAIGQMQRIPLDGIPLETLLREHNFTQVDWISVDCEGCEASFITGFDFTEWGVQIVNYEPNTAARMHTQEIEAALSKHGFIFDRELQDRIWRQPGPLKLRDA
jgi:hypothetical protein